MACHHSVDNQTLQLHAGAGEDGFMYLLSGPDHVACKHQEEGMKNGGYRVYIRFSDGEFLVTFRYRTPTIEPNC